MDPIRYVLDFPNPHTHYVDVTATVPTDGRTVVELMMAVWTPGSYLVREFARHVEEVTASSGNTPLLVTKTRKNRWAVETGGAAEFTLRYRVYGREMSVRTNWIEADFALINGAATFMTIVDSARRAHVVRIEMPPTWPRCVTALPTASGGAHAYSAEDFDQLVDSPFLLGNPNVHGFVVDDRPHALVNEGEAGVFDGSRAAEDVERIVCEYRRMWGTLPYDRYFFLNVITEAGGGLEHASSTVLMTTRWTTRTRKAYLAWLGLASHEFFHVWNVKRLRPVELGPFDYERENHTRSLWVAEGFTDYYTDLVVHRAGLSTREEYLEALSSKIEALQTTPGRLVQPLSLASFDAWIKHYRPDENSLNTAISYYTKGAIVAFLIDARIRAASGGAQSLDDVLHAAYERFSGLRGFTADEIRALIEEVAGERMDRFWADAVDGTVELDYGPALETFGLQFRPAPPPAAKAWLGATMRNDAGRLVVAQVRRDGPAAVAGLNVDDELVAIDDIRVRADRLDERLEQYRAGDQMVLLVARRERLRALAITAAEEPPRAWRIEVAPTVTIDQAHQLDAWLSGRRAPVTAS